MKSLFVSIILGSFCLLATAQTKENGFFMELNGGYGTVEYSTSKSTTHDGYLFLAPRLGYQFNHQWAAGVKTRFELAAEKYSSFGVYGQYAFLQAKRIKIFGEASASFSTQSSDGGDSNYTEAGLSFGA